MCTITYFPIIPTISSLSLKSVCLGLVLLWIWLSEIQSQEMKNQTKAEGKMTLILQDKGRTLLLLHLHLSFYALWFFIRVILFDKKMFIPTHLYTRKKNSEVNGRERPSLHCITNVITQRTTIGFKIQLGIHLSLSLSMNSEESKHRTSIHF